MTDRQSFRHRHSLALTLVAALVAGAALPAPRAAALPMYASREGATCNTCHIDPNGGGIRNEFGFAYGRNRHATEPEPRWASVTVDPKLNDWITLGLDVRVMYVASHVNGGGDTFDTSTFFPMQGQVNLAVMPHEHLTLVASHGLTTDDRSLSTRYVARELYGMVEGLPAGLYARVGRFRLPFGLRQDDHTSFTRDGSVLLYDSQKSDAGLEVGRIGTPWFFQFSVVNDREPFTDNVARVTGKIGRASQTFQAGISGLHRYPGDNLWSVYASATRSRFTVLGEYVGGTVSSTTYKNREASFAEVDYRLSRALNLRAKIDYSRGFRDLPRWIKRRYVGEIDIVPVPFVETRLSYRYHDSETDGISKEYLALFYFPF